MISIKHLNKYYNKGRQNQIHVIDDVSIELPERGMVAIFGRSGCGKTTLLNVIGGLDKFAGGEVFVCGENISKDTDDIRNKNIGYIFQNYNLNKSETVIENVADALRLCGLTDKSDINARALTALKNVGMDSFRNRLPDNLSGGQQQRVAIARAIVKNPKIILADEPTGNLDEANTVMVMDLLRQIADDHLVVLVTHEENLVDYYCDTVICVSDGKITDIRSNQITGGYVTRDKNDIYLGELEKTQFSDDHAEIQYFGDAPSEPIKLRIVNNGGRMYVKIDTPSVSVIDSGSEIKLREGVFKSEERKNDISSHIDMSALPPADGGKYGKLFDFKKSFSAGLNINFRRNRFGKRLLKFCMGMFAAVLVFMTAIFGTGIGQLIDAKDTYNHNTFYVYTNKDVYEKLNEAYENRQYGIDYLLGQSGASTQDVTFFVGSGSFETFSPGNINTIDANAGMLRLELAEGCQLIAGRSDGITGGEVIITDKVADMILDKATVGYLKDYGDLIGLTLKDNMSFYNNDAMRIVGIVRSSENAVFINERTIAKKVVNQSVIPADELGIDVPAGKVVRIFPNKYLDVNKLKLSEDMYVGFKKLSVSDNLIYQWDYYSWLEENGKKVISEQDFFEGKMIADHPEDREMIKQIMEGVNFDAKYDEFIDLFNEYWAEAVDKYAFDYLDVLYEYLDEYVESQKIFKPFIYEIWAALEKQDFTEFYIQYYSWGNYYEDAKQYKAINGVYPLLSMYEDQEIVYVDGRRYFNEFMQVSPYASMYSDTFYVVNPNDFLTFSRMPVNIFDDISSLYSDEYDWETELYNKADPYYEYDVLHYSVVHSNDVDATREFLELLVEDVDSDIFGEGSWYQKLVTPEMSYVGNLSEYRAGIISNLIAMVCVLAVMCLCMYFIMRSSTMNRVREVGIYRAIGVTKKNLVFKFMIESLILTTLTVFVGFLISSVIIYLWMGYSPSMEQFLFYPPWLAAVLLAVIYAVCTFCGVLPVRLLLSKSPSQIISKYDI